MENRIENNGNANGVLVGILLIILILLGGFVVYDKFIKTEEATNCSKCEEKQCSKDECNCPSCDSTTTTNSYQIFSANLKKKITSWNLSSGYFLAQNGYWSEYENGGKYYVTYKIILTNKMELKLVFDPDSQAEWNHQGKYIAKYGEEIKIADNVIGVTVANYGSGAYQNIYFINENGTIGVAEPYALLNGETNKLRVTNPLSGYSNIVSIVQGTFDGVGSTQDPYAIDINGNAHAIQSAWN